MRKRRSDRLLCDGSAGGQEAGTWLRIYNQVRKVSSPESVCSEQNLDEGQVGREHHTSLDSEFWCYADSRVTLTPL